MHIKKIIFLFIVLLMVQVSAQEKNEKTTTTNPPIYIAFLWHMHQPIYWPYESIVTTQNNNRYPFSLYDIHNQRTGPYTSWPKNAVQKGIAANLPHFGAQVSFSGSLIENLNNLEASGNGNFSGWKSSWNSIRTQQTSLGNPRLDMVAFGYHHPLMGLIEYSDIRKQIQLHKQIFSQSFGGNYSKGMFPPENAFTPKMIPALVDEGINWILIDNVHFDRSSANYPFSNGGNLYEANKSDVINPDPNDWVALNGLWAPTKISGKWGHQPHYVEYVDPVTGIKSKMIAVPADRYMGNEDGRGGFGALNYESVMSQLESFNTDPQHPIILVLAHDGDNYGGGSEGYYGGNFQNFVNWVAANPTRFVCTTIEDYLEMYPPAASDIIHVEDGSWSGADNGDPEFKKWNGDPGSDGYSADRNSWGVITAAKNIVQTAEQINSSSSATIQAWKNLLNAETSCYWYWDGSMNGLWDSHPARGSNLAVQSAMSVVNSGTDLTPPTIYAPQREPYNPGGTEWGISQSSNFKIWSYVFDIKGLKTVTLKYRIDIDGQNPLTSIQNETYTGGAEVGAWTELPMTSVFINPQTDPLPMYKAKEFTAEITGLKSKFVDYYIEAVDSNNNIGKSPIKHVWIGDGTGTSTGSLISWTPANPTKNDTITVSINGTQTGAKLHWGVNNNGSQWSTPDQVYWPEGTVLFGGSGPAVESPFTGTDTIKIKIGPFNKPEQTVSKVAFVIHFNDNTWNNNNGSDYHIEFGGGSTQGFVMDGSVDPNTELVAENEEVKLYVGWDGNNLYTATQSASTAGNDVFVFISDSLRTLTAAPWAKAGQVSGWSAYLANESTNNWCGWTDATGSSQKFAGSYLEGTLNVSSEFGHIPSKLYIAVGRYATGDNGALVKQVPGGNSNGNIDPAEFYTFNYIINNLEVNNIPVEFSLSQNYPNPFNPSTRLDFNINKAGLVSLKVFDMLGREVETLVDDYKTPGRYTVTFDAKDLSSGVYFCILKSGEQQVSNKMIYLK